MLLAHEQTERLVEPDKKLLKKTNYRIDKDNISELREIYSE
jgi:predicted HicB family RNase H-like nuclease